MESGIETERTTLTLLTESDFADMLTMLMDPETSRFIKHLHRRKQEEYENVLLNRLEQIRTQTGFHWVGRLKSTGELVGAVNLSIIPGTSRMQLGFQLNQKFWNRGFATELAEKALEAGLKKKKLAAVYGVFEKENQASGKVLEKLGFKAIQEVSQAEENDITYIFTPINSQL